MFSIFYTNCDFEGELIQRFIWKSVLKECYTVAKVLVFDATLQPFSEHLKHAEDKW